MPAELFALLIAVAMLDPNLVTSLAKASLQETLARKAHLENLPRIGLSSGS
jgi:hypothetical protein